MKEPDWKNCAIYKLVCKDLAVKDCYVGSTCSWVSRKANHKQSITNEKATGYNCKKSQTIRENGGWINWQMVLVENYPCESREQAHKREREITEQLEANMNSIRAYRSDEDYKEQQKAKYQANIESILEYHKSFYQANKEAIREYDKARYQANRETIREQQKSYRDSNKEAILEQKKSYYQAKKQAKKQAQTQE